MVYDLTETMTLSKKRRPLLSIIISANNDVQALKKCIEPLLNADNDLRNIEVVVINNFSEDVVATNSIKMLISRANSKANMFVLYQCTFYSTTAQLKNLGIDFSKGTWLFFINQNEILTKKFINFLATYKFNLQNAFYRVSMFNEKHKKKRMGIVKSKFFSDLPSSIIINEEFVERIHLRWESNLNTNETLLFLDKLYAAKNVNYEYLNKCYSVVHNFVLDSRDEEVNDFINVKKAFDELLKHKTRFSKQFGIILLFNYVKRNKARRSEASMYHDVKLLFRDKKITYFTYFKLGPKLFFKTIRFKWKTIF